MKMSNLIKTLNELGEVKLSSEKIELGISSELGKLKTEAEKVKESQESVSKEIVDLSSKIRKLLNKAEENEKKAISIEKQQGKLWGEFKTKAKELDINPKDTPAFKSNESVLTALLLIPTYKELDKIRKI